MAREIIKKDGFGLQGLNKGLTATIGRNGVFNMIYFGFYHSVKDYFPAYEVCNDHHFIDFSNFAFEIMRVTAREFVSHINFVPEPIEAISEWDIYFI